MGGRQERVVVADDHRLMTEVLQSIIREVGCVTTGVASDGPAAIETVLRTRPEVVVLGLELPVIDGAGVIKAIREAGCAPRILVISNFCSRYAVHLIDQLHVHGFLGKSDGVNALRRALETIVRGAPYFSNDFLRQKRALRNDTNAFNKVLTDHEIAVATLVSDGFDDHEIGDLLDISDATAKKHRFNIMKKLGLMGRRAFRQYSETVGFRRTFAATDPHSGNALRDCGPRA